MSVNKPDTTKFLKYIFSYIHHSIGLLLLFFLLLPFKVKATDIIIERKLDPIISFDEVPVNFIVNGYLRFETDVIITESNKVYIDIEDLFKNLGIYCKVENEGNQLSGFIENESKKYTIDFNTKQITVENKTIESENGIVKELGAIYVESTIITEAFGLTMIFNYRSLSIKLESNFELPLVKQMRLAQMRKNISKLQDKEIIADTILKRDYHLFKFGMLDWSIASYQTKNEISNNRIDLGIGTELLYGQANVSINYNDQYKFDNRNLYYNWRWVDNDKKYIKQAQLGKIYSQSISFLEAPVVGVAINNSPNTVRKASGFHTINEYTEPNWTVELYINDVLVDYTVADASGLYVFKVPIVYGYTILKLKFYGPLGEERIEERTMNVPFTFVPAKTLEYSASGGVLQDDENSKFGQGVVNYGLNRFITIGGGLEYLSSIPDKPLIPFATVAFQPFSKLVLNFEYAHDVRMKGLLNYNFGKSAFLEVDYANYAEGQLATRFNANEERKVRVSLPFKLNKVSGYTKLNFNQFVYDAFNYNQFDAVFSGYYKNYSANISTLLNWIGDKPAYITSNVSLSYRMRNGLVFRPSAEYNISDNQLLRFRAEIEKRVAKMYFSTSYERNILSKTDNVFLSFRYDLPFARTGFSSSYSNNTLSFSESAQGSLAFGADNGVVKTGNNSALGKGGILFYPFLDLNQNGKLDKGEQKVLLTNVRVNGGKAIISKKDSIVRVSDLNAFINYNVEFSDNDLDNISWRFKHKTYQVLVDPNQYKRVNVPVISIGEVSGTIHNNLEGIGRITIQIYDKKGNKVGETLSERDGYFNYLGLKPGEYNIRIDEKQLEKLGYQSTPKIHNAVIKMAVDGDIIENLDFEIYTPEKIVKESSIQIDTAQVSPVYVNPIKVNSAKEKKPKSEEQPGLNKKTDINERSYTIQIGVFKEDVTLKQLFNLAPIFYEVLPNGDFRYVFGKYSSLKDAVNAKNGLMLKGIKGATVITYQNGEEKNLVDFNALNAKTVQDNKAKEASNNEIVTSNNIDASFSKISEIEGSFYSVQLGVFRKVVTPKQLLNLTPIFYEVLPNETTRYISGKYDLLKTAKNARNKIVVKGIKDAFVVAYQNGKKIDVFELDKIRKHAKIMNGKIYGSVRLNNLQKIEGVKNITILLFNQNGFMVGGTTTDINGNFEFVNLTPGEYIIKIDSNQLEQLQFKATPLVQNILIKESSDGDLVEGLDFLLTKLTN